MTKPSKSKAPRLDASHTSSVPCESAPELPAYVINELKKLKKQMDERAKRARLPKPTGE